MKGQEIILELRDGCYRHVKFLDREENHRAETAFRNWLKMEGEDGRTYIAAKFLTEELSVKKVTRTELLSATDLVTGQDYARDLELSK